MGTWSDSIMGGDTPLDIEMIFEEEFGDPQHPFPTKPSSEAALALIDRLIQEGEDACCVRQVVGFLVMQREAEMSDELRDAIISGALGEDVEEMGWNEPEKRLAVLTDFAKQVRAYPANGGKVDMPHQPGLFEVILGS